METVDTRQGIVELRNQAFRLADSLSREATRSSAGSGVIEAATEMQTVAYLLGRVEQSLVDAEGAPSSHELRVVSDRLTAA